MERGRSREIELLQPYMPLKTTNFEKIVVKQYGISHFYEFKICENHKKQLQAVPDGSVDLLFGIEKDRIHTYIGGTVLKAKDWPLYEGTTYFGVSFQPGKCILPKDVEIGDLINEDLELDNSSIGRSLVQQIGEECGIVRHSRTFLKEYMKSLQKENDANVLLSLEDYIRNRIYEQKGNIAIQTLSEETGYSPCYIRRVFKQIHGISPKVFEKFVRFQNVLNRMGHREQFQTLDQIAVDCGYYDQSHMVKDFKCFAGMTPEKYLGINVNKK